MLILLKKLLILIMSMIFGKFLQKENFMIIKKTRNETENLLKILNPFLQQNQRIRTQPHQNVNFNKKIVMKKNQ